MKRFNFLFALAVLIIFTALVLSGIENINPPVIVGLLLFGVLMFSLVGMADTEVVNYLR